MFGGREGIRTLDLSVANAALSQLSYAPTRSLTFGNITRLAKRRQASRHQTFRESQGSIELTLRQAAALGEIPRAAALPSEFRQSLFHHV